MEENQVSIPDGWKSKKLGSVCKIKKGIQFNKIELSAFGMHPCINGGIEPSGYSDLWNTNENTITISEGGNSCGYVNLVKTKFWSGGHCYSLLDLGNELDNDFLYQALKGRQHLIMDLRVGSGLPNIQQKAIKEFEFLIPDDKPEQTQIASILSKVDEAITQTERLIAKYTRIKTGLMQDLLTKGIDEQGNIRGEATHEFKDSPLGRIPKEWEEVSFYDCVSIVNGQKDPKKAPYINWILIAPDHIESKTGRIIKFETASQQNAISGKYAFEKDDVVYSKIRPYLRKAILAKFDGLCSADMYPLRPKSNIKAEYLFYNILSEKFSQYAESVSERSGFPKINRQELSHFNFAIPKLDEQERIISVIRQTDQTFLSLNDNHSKLQSLKTGLMQDLLSGKVRVNHLIKRTMKV